MRTVILAAVTFLASLVASAQPTTPKGRCYAECYKKASPCYGTECRMKQPACYQKCDAILPVPSPSISRRR